MEENNEFDEVIEDEIYDIDDYNLPEQKTVFLDPENKEVVAEEELTPWMIIKSMAKVMGVEVRKPRSNCKHCYERGYVGFKAGTKEPVACGCVFTTEQKKKDMPIKFNREQRRSLERKFKKESKKNPKTQKEIVDNG